MSASVNKVILQGNLGRDPELRFSPDGIAICNISIATQRSWSKDGQKIDEVEWHRVVFYNKMAELVGEKAKKGESLYVEGRIKTRKYQDKETGADRFSNEIIAERFQFNGGRTDSQSDIPPQARKPQGQSRGAGSAMDMDDSGIPF